ncbi:hypothetical protein DXG01_004708 [Tephrocybe rancida]|nr:hypothetical protein DXG01_004708 [Tephrocybe rancida]
MCILSFAFTLGSLSAASTAARYGASQKASTTGNIAVASLALSLATNAVATGFIAYVLRTHLKSMKANMGERYQRMFKLESILVLLVDSGASYMVLQAC